jgi:signal transduction histidine kinase
VEQLIEAEQAGVPPFQLRRLARDIERQQRFERDVNQETLDRLRTAGLAGLAGLAVISLVIGWFVSGRLLSPVARITARARELGERAPDLSGRIDLGGPDDELKELADTLDAFLDRTEGAVAGQRRFLADASHELRTPLAAARTNIEVVLADPDSTREDYQRAAEVANRQLTRMGRIVGDLLLLERGRAGSMGMVPLRELARAVVADLGPRARQGDITLVVEGGAEIRVRSDQDTVRRILANLVENAIIYNNPGGRVDVAVATWGGQTTLAVTDTGRGIPPAELERVFERFHRGTRDVPGTGLGLAIVRELAESIGAKVQVESTVGEGSRFEVLFDAPSWGSGES